MGLYVTFAALGSSWGATTLKVLLVLIGLNLVILVHELGHFVVARLCGVKCEKFYVWFDIFGWKLLRFKRGETEYGLGVLPLGGYVKMLGQEDNPARLRQEIERAKARPSNSPPDAEDPIESAQQALFDPRSYLAKSVPKRMAIISAGVIMNVVFAFVAAVFAYALGVEHNECAVGAVFPGEAAWQANLRVGDRIEQIAGKPVSRFNDLRAAVSVGNIENGVPLVLLRSTADGGEERLEVTLAPDRFRAIPTIGITASPNTSLDERAPAFPGSPAALAQPPFRGGDRIVRIGDVPVTSYAQIHSQQALHPDDPLRVTVRRAVDQPDGNPAAPATYEEVTVNVAAAPIRRLGLLLEMGPITAVQKDSPAARAGIKPGDRIIGIEGQEPGDPLDPLTLPDRIRRLAEQKSQLTLSLNRDGKPIDVQVLLRRPDQFASPIEPTSPMTIPALGIAYRVPPRIREVEEGTPADRAGLRGGEEVVRAKLIRAAPETLAGYGVAKEDADDFQRAELTVPLEQAEANWTIVFWLLQECLPGTRVELTLKDGRTFELTPVESTDWFHPERGFRFQSLNFTQTAGSVSEAIALGARETWDSLTLIFRTLRSLGTGQVSFRGVTGPVGIFQIALDYAARGLASLLVFLCLISANLAVVNFIPIPVLDGGHMIFLAYEGVRGKPPSENVLTTLTFAGLVLLLTLMLWVTGADIFRILGWLGW